MRRKTTTIVAIVAIVAVVLIWGIGTNNRMARADEQVEQAWAQVENVYQRRLDLVPQLVATVQGAADYERAVLTEVTNARAGVQQASVDPTTLSEDQVRNYQQAQDRLSRAMANTIKVTRESYPEITATQGFRDLQTQLEGTENRIAVERRNFNDAVQHYNSQLRVFPANIIARLCGYSKHGYFAAPAEAAEAVKVEFDF